MANTERLAVIRMVREAKRMAQNIRYDTSLEIDLRVRIEELFVELDRLEDDLILEAVEEKVAALEKGSRRLTAVAEQIKSDNRRLEAFAAKVEKAADGLKTLVEIAGKAAAFVV